MSKRLGNAVDPFTTIEEYGSDPLRWYMITNSQPWDNLKFDVAGVDEVKRKFFGTLYNTYGFFALYANVDNFHYAETEVPINERPEIDRWILSLLNSLIKEVAEAYEKYEPTRAGRAIQDFVKTCPTGMYAYPARDIGEASIQRTRFRLTKPFILVWKPLPSCLLPLHHSTRKNCLVI